MKRREFLKGLSIVSVASMVLGKASGLLNTAWAGATYVTAGKLGYKEVATDVQVKAGKTCASCSWFKDDKKEAGAGQCTLKPMTAAMKAPEVYVKAAGSCNMWKKKA